MPVIDWNKTSRNPMAFARRPGAVPEAASTATLTAFVVDGFTKADSPGHCPELQGFLFVAIRCRKENYGYRTAACSAYPKTLLSRVVRDECA
jgi:hypothetical protein